MCNSFFFNDTATTEIYTLSLHDALPISHSDHAWWIIHAIEEGEIVGATSEITLAEVLVKPMELGDLELAAGNQNRSEEHTSELQSRLHLVCRLLLEKKNGILARAAFQSN